MAMRRDLLAEAVETAESLLKDGHPLAPFLITDHWGDRRVEQFEGEGLQGAKTRFRDFMRTAAGDESCALVYTGAVADADEAIVIECGQTGQRRRRCSSSTIAPGVAGCAGSSWSVRRDQSA